MYEGGRGNGFREQDTLARKDDRVNIVAWKEFHDRNTSKLIMFGQCAGGAEDWKEKVTDLKPDAFWGQWVRDANVSPHLRSFYIPHRVDRKHWDFHARYAGIMFDRCRIAYWAFRDNATVLRDPRYGRWYQFVLGLRKKNAGRGVRKQTHKKSGRRGKRG